MEGEKFPWGWLVIGLLYFLVKAGGYVMDKVEKEGGFAGIGKKIDTAINPSKQQSNTNQNTSKINAIELPYNLQQNPDASYYVQPPTGYNLVLNIPQIRWCIRSNIRIETMRNRLQTNNAVNAFNRIVDDYNSRCGNYRYRSGSLSAAHRDVEQYRSQIVNEAIRDATMLGNTIWPQFGN